MKRKISRKGTSGLTIFLALGLLAGCASAPTVHDVCQPGYPTGITAPTVKLVTLNIAHGRGDSWNQMLVSSAQIKNNLDNVATLLNDLDSDVVALQEADAASNWSGKFDHVEYLTDNTSYLCVLHGRHKNSSIATFGTALLSKSALSNSQSVQFEPSPPTNPKGFVRSTLQWQSNGKSIPLTVVSVHLDFSRKSVRDSQIRELTENLSDINSPLVIMGDLNSEWSDKRSSVKSLAEALDLSVYTADASGLGTYKKPSGKRLDWYLISKHLVFTDYKVIEHPVSDHLAVYASVALRDGQSM